MVGIDVVADTALDIHTQQQGVEEVRPAHRHALGQGQDGGNHRAARVDHRLQMGVVKVHHVRGDAVDQGRMHDVGLFRPAQQRSLALAEEGAERLDRDIHRLLAGPAHGHGHIVEEGAHAFGAEGLGRIARLGRHDIGRQLAGDVGGDGGVLIGQFHDGLPVRRPARPDLIVGAASWPCRPCGGRIPCLSRHQRSLGA